MTLYETVPSRREGLGKAQRDVASDCVNSEFWKKGFLDETHNSSNGSSPPITLKAIKFAVRTDPTTSDSGPDRPP